MGPAGWRASAAAGNIAVDTAGTSTSLTGAGFAEWPRPAPSRRWRAGRHAVRTTVTGSAAGFFQLGDLLVDGAGNVYAAELYAIRKVTPAAW